MEDEGVNGLSLAEVARRLGVQPPSLYKYFPSLMADSDEAIFLVSILMAGTLSQVMANEPLVAWGEGRFSPLLPKLMSLLPLAYPPRSRVPRRKSGTSR